MTTARISALRACTAMLTPFSAGRVAFHALEAALERQIVAEVDGVVIGDVLGEDYALSAEEREAVLSACIAQARRRFAVIAATGTNSTKTTLERCLRAEAFGADVLLVTIPYYSKPGLKGVVDHFRQIGAATGLPVIVDDDPGRTAVDYGVPLLEALAGVDAICGICHGAGRLQHFALLSAHLRQRYIHFSRDEATVHPFLQLGGNGVVSSSGNLLPADLRAIIPKNSAEIRLPFAGFALAASRLGQDVAALKAVASALYGGPHEVRLPLVPCDGASLAAVVAALSASRQRS